MKHLFRLLAVTIGLFTGSQAFAAAASTVFITQSNFDKISAEVGAVTSFRSIAPADALGITGFDVGIAATSGTIDNTSVVLPSIKFQKGLPGGFDISGYYMVPVSVTVGTVSDTATNYGAAVSYAVLKGVGASPALSIKGSYTMFSIPGAIETNTMGLDLEVSKGFGLVSPYAGAGMVQISSTDKSATTFLNAYSASATKYYAGFNLNLKVMDIAMEAGAIGGVQSYSIKAGFRF